METSQHVNQSYLSLVDGVQAGKSIEQQTHAVTLSVATLMLQQKIQTVASVVEHIVLHLITVTMGFTATKQATFVEFQPTS